ncbi:MAG TPA: response regulator [Patescibacteria group bacterium]|nr:response regulator [Patescibacteria group bacterium]
MVKVLLVEDEELVARMYEKALRFAKYDTVLAIGGKEGLEKAESENPDFIFLDIMMPEPDGIEVLDKLKSNPKTAKIPIVMLTNLSGKNDAELAMEKGAAGYLIKSKTDIAKLGDLVEKYLGSASKSG